MAWSEAIPPPADVPLARLPRIVYSKLVSGDTTELDRLFTACKEGGFVYLDLHDKPIMKKADTQYEIGAEVFALEDSVKKVHRLKLEPGANLYHTSYKAPGLGVVDHKGNKDWIEFMNISTQELFNDKEPLNAPKVINERKKDLRSFASDCHSIISDHQPNAHHMLTTNRNVTPTALLAHTDASTITLVFNQLSGLQMLPPGIDNDDAWQWVQPLHGCAILVVGDALSIFTNGLLKSVRHRVVKPWGREAEFKRYSLAYAVRPDDDTIMREIGQDGNPVEAMEGEKDVTALEWNDAKFRFLVQGRGFVMDPTKKVGEQPKDKIFGY